MGEKILKTVQASEAGSHSSGVIKSQSTATANYAVANTSVSAAASNDAALVDLPRSAPSTLPAGKASEPIQSIFGAGVSAADIVSAHAGLDTARAFALLDDD